MRRYGEGRVFLEMYSKRRRDKSQVATGNSDWERGKDLSPTRVVKHRNELPRETVKSALGDFQNSAKQVPCLSKEVGLDLHLRGLPTIIIF